MLDRNALSSAVLLLTVATPVFAQDSKPSTALEDAIQDPMPRSRAAGIAPGGSAQTRSSEPSAHSTAPVGEKAAKAEPTIALSINPAMLLLGGIGAEVDVAVAPIVSFFVAPSFIFGNSILAPKTDVSVSGVGLEGGLRFFAGKKAPKGFWLGPYAGVAFASASAGNITAEATGISYGGMLGYSWIFNNTFYCSLGAGGGAQTLTLDSPIGSSTSTRPVVALRLALGFAL